MKKLLLLIISFLSLFSAVRAQIDRETRAVWLSTNFRLDWPPPTYEKSKQQQALLEIFDNIEKKNLNTIYFQVRFNSTVLFKSNYEPWSYYLSGEVDGEPSYDPLEFAVTEAHKRGLEIHAWVNAIRCLSGSEKQLQEYDNHLIKIHQNWVHKRYVDDQISYWLDPGLPEVREYLTNVVTEIAAAYDVDGIQLDFIRYPKGGIDDDFSYSIYGEGKAKDEWRRDNITKLIDSVGKGIARINPLIKFGVTPIGIYKNGDTFNGLSGFSTVYQDSHKWLEEELIDYVAPQVYWNFEDNPKFDIVSTDWIKNSHGKNVIIGIASYKEDVYPETYRMIEFTREADAHGIAFFRYSNIKTQQFPPFKYKALPSKMEWKDNYIPIEPERVNFSVVDESENKFTLSWNMPVKTKEGHGIKYYALFNLENERGDLNSQSLFKFIHSNKNAVTFSINNPKKINYFYSVKTIDKFWNESSGNSDIVKLTIPYLKTIAGEIVVNTKPVFIKNSNGNVIIINTNTSDQITLKGISTNDTLETGHKLIMTAHLERGKNILNVPGSIQNFIELELDYKIAGKKERLKLK